MIEFEDIRRAARAERARAIDILTACKAAGHHDTASAYIASNMTAGQVRDALATAAAATDRKVLNRVNTFDARAIAAELAATPRPTIQ